MITALQAAFGCMLGEVLSVPLWMQILIGLGLIQFVTSYISAGRFLFDEFFGYERLQHFLDRSEISRLLLLPLSNWLQSEFGDLIGLYISGVVASTAIIAYYLMWPVIMLIEKGLDILVYRWRLYKDRQNTRTLPAA